MTSSNTTILIRKSVVSGNTPTELANGEIALNSADGKIFYADPIGDIVSISNQNTFHTINANSSLIVASSPTDTLSLSNGNNVTIDGNGVDKKITIGVVDSPNFLGTLSVNTNAQIYSTEKTTSGLSQQTVDTFSITALRSAKYYAQISSGSNYHVIELRVLHDGTTVYMVQYGEMTTSFSLGNFDAEIDGSNLKLLFTPALSTATIKLTRHGIPL
jgi:hypothetical protein